MSNNTLDPVNGPVYRQMASTHSSWFPGLTPGPYWGSFENFRTSGNTALESIRTGCVGTLSTKAGVFRILRDDDFQRLIGLAAEVHRIRDGITFIVSAARVVQKHRDEESIQHLIESVSLLGGSPVLPVRDGHDRFRISADEVSENSEDLDLTTIPRPTL